MKIFIPMLMFCLVLQAKAQQTPQLYAYTQRVSGGANIGEATMDGNITVQKKRNEGTRQLIYLSLPSNAGELTITELWINGKPHHFSVAEVKGPIVDESGIRMPSEKRKVLVPAGPRVLQILPGKEITGSELTGKNTRKGASDNQVFVCYRVGNKLRSLGVKQPESLQDLLME